ncbi:MAG: carbohydrate-binding family 9-like protein [Proteobacteria bacterium]|nr:carbohydrate-binding family 9-like protein [Pseudomonadota bacterium]
MSRNAPQPERPLDVVFENKIALLGYDMTPSEAKAGKLIKLTWYWRADQELEAGWAQFTHVADTTDQTRLNADRTGPIRRLYPPSRWKPGQYITDAQELTIPKEWNHTHARFYLGFWNGPHRLHVSKGDTDGEHRALVLSLPVQPATPAKASTGLPDLSALRTSHKPTIDGKLDEKGWHEAVPSARFVHTVSGNRSQIGATVRMLYDDSALYVAFDVSDTYLFAPLDKHDDHLWKHDTVEIMLDPDGDGRDYFEIQVSPAGTVFDTRYDSPRQPKPFGHVQWSSRAEAAVGLRGRLDDETSDQGYTVEIALPWASLGEKGPPSIAGTHGRRWRANFFVMDRQRGDTQLATGWSPPLVGDFHVPNRFGYVAFAPDP